MTFEKWAEENNLSTQDRSAYWARKAYSAGAEQMRERAANKVREWFDENKDCDCGTPIRKYNTENGHAMNCSFYEGVEIVDAIRNLSVGESSRAPEGSTKK